MVGEVVNDLLVIKYNYYISYNCMATNNSNYNLFNTQEGYFRPLAIQYRNKLKDCEIVCNQCGWSRAKITRQNFDNKELLATCKDCINCVMKKRMILEMLV